jgi:mRNA interferase MazF
LSDFFNIGCWLSKKMEYHKKASLRTVRKKQVLQGEIWECDLGFNVGEEKNKKRFVIVISNNKVNRTGKVVVAPITDAVGKINSVGLPQHNTWYLLYTASTNPSNWYDSTRTVPRSAVQYSWLTKDSVIQCEELRSVSKARLLNSKVGDLDPNDFSRLKTKIKKVFDIL